jgi:hypothetical protein
MKSKRTKNVQKRVRDHPLQIKKTKDQEQRSVMSLFAIPLKKDVQQMILVHLK